MRQNEDKIDSLLVKILTRTASQEEIEEVELWALESRENWETLNAIKKLWKEQSAATKKPISKSKIDDIWEKGMLKKKDNSFFYSTFVKYAAIILFIFGFYSTYYYFIAANQEIEKNEVIEYTVLTNPAGKKTKHTLPDGSVVFLNCSSSIKFIKAFNSEERKVYLKGEAYFEVAKNVNKPFIVESNGIATKALGTIFNISAYPGYNTMKVSLFEGKVEIQNPSSEKLPILLPPGKELLVNIKQDSYTKSSFNPELVAGWKVGKLVFDNADFKEVKVKLERWFGLEIKIKGKKPNDWKVSTIYEKESLKNILTDLQYAKRFAYEINDNQVTIQF
ncbi:FecR domain-containing protein [Cyclobacterium sp. 1_MG-2023]|uniref:FecR family protein n=1 Tax=Cyclobacterium sp. 1_MG-2023 TaxID=3062681 RepID=UPI0026E44A61|nr:FecR family protein [Cyclobacterium sp. 1_MG-2023]MDO6436098.1 FecR domain-containing protein [Cyclobacterium sp. 1_MG-2023]